MATYDVDFEDDVFYGENNVFHETHIYAAESVFFDDEFRVLDTPAHNEDSVSFDEAFDLELDIFRTWEDTVGFGESPVARSSAVSRSRTDTLHYFDLWFADSDAFSGALGQIIHYTETWAATKVIAPDRRLLDEILSYLESYSAIKFRPTQDSISFHESWCYGFNVVRSITDSIQLSEAYFRRIGDNPYDPRNNPAVINDGSGFTMTGNVRRKYYDVLQFREIWTPVNASGNPIQFAQCLGTILKAKIVSVQVTALDQATITFDQPITVISNIPDSNFTIGGFAPTLSNQGLANTVDLVASSAVWNVGDTWQLIAEPDWLQETVELGSGIRI